MSSFEAMIRKKVQSFANSILNSLESEKELNELDRQGKTWNVVGMDGTLIQRGIRGLGISSGSDDQRLLIQE